MNTIARYALLALVLSLNAFADGPKLVAGPMVGHVTETSAVVWAHVQFDARATAEAVQNGARIPGIEEQLLDRRFRLYRFHGLIPGQPVYVNLRFEPVEAKERYDLFFTTPNPPQATGTLRIAFGSCSKDGQRPFVPVFEAMAVERPDFALFVGDNSYMVVGGGNWSTSGAKGEWDSSETMIARHLTTRTNPYLQRLLRSVPCYGIWDDHDYGPNNSDRSFPNKELSLSVFSMIWANPSYGTSKTKGIYSSFRRGPADIFLMDDRYHKWVKTEAHPDVAPKDAVIWGDEQLEWLLDGLKRSTAPVKIIANGTQVISKDGRGEGHFNEAPEEAARLFTFLKENRIGGIVFLSGDRHFTEVLRLPQDDGPDILEFTSSPIQQGQAVAPLVRDHPTHVWAMNGNSYGLVTLNVEENGGGTVRFEMRDANNYVPVVNEKPTVSEYPLSSLMYPKE